jgi:hypothetical protein
LSGGVSREQEDLLDRGARLVWSFVGTDVTSWRHGDIQAWRLTHTVRLAYHGERWHCQIPEKVRRIFGAQQDRVNDTRDLLRWPD